MAGKTLSIKISAQDDASAILRKIGDAAQTMGAALEEASGSGAGMKGLAEEIRSLDTELSRVGTGLAAVGAAGTAIFGLATRSSMEFTASMSNVNSIARLTTSELAAMEETILGMASAYGALPVDLAEGLYDIIGSGFEDAAEAALILEKAVVAAGAGLTTTSTAVQAITAVLNAFGMEAEEAGNVSDVLFKTVDSGVLTFEQLAGSLGRVLPLASTLNVSIEELGAAYAELTLRGISASEAETAVAGIMRAAISPTKELTDAVREYGYESAEALIQAEGLAGFLEFLAEASGGSSAAMGELVADARALQGALALTANEGENFNAMLETMGGAASDGAYTLEVWGIQMDNAAGAVRSARAEMEIAAINLGSAFEPIVAGAARAVDGILSAFNALPDGAQAAASYIGAGTSAIALFTGTAMLAIPKALEFADALRRIRQAGNLGSLLSTAGRITAVGAAASIAAVAFTGMIAETRSMVAAAKDLDAVLLDLKIGGETDLVQQVDDVRDAINEAISDFEGGIDLPGIFDPLEGAFKEENVSAAIRKGISENIKTALEDARIDTEAFLTWINDRLANIDTSSAEGRQAFRDFLTELADPEVLVQFGASAEDAAGSTDNLAESLDGAGDAAETATTSLEGLRDVIGDLPAMLDDLRLEGRFDLAKMLEGADDALIEAFSGIDLDNITLAPWEELIPVDLTEEQLGRIGTAVDRIMTGIANETLDAGAIWEDFLAILSDTSMTAEQQIAAIEALSTSLSDYRDHQAAMLEGQIDFLAQGENLLAWWEQYDAALWQGAAAFDGTAAQAAAFNAEMQELADFRGLVDLVQDLEAAGAALDSVLRTFDRIDSLGDRSSAAGAIADHLFGPDGDPWDAIGPLREVYDAGLISVEQFNATIEDGIAIQESNARTQLYLNKIRADQLPLLAEEQAAYEAQIEQLSQLPALEQRRALAMQDTAVQSQIAALYSQAYAASVGEIPEEVATEMIVSAAQADPVLADLLEQFGLIEVGAEGEITVNFPNADATIGAINRLTIAFLEMEAAASGMTGFELAVKIYGEEEALELYGLVKNADGTYSEATLAVKSEGAEEAQETLREVTLADGTVVQVKVEADTEGWEDLTAAELSAKFDNDPVKLPVEATIKPMDGVTEEEWNAMLGPFPEIGVPVVPEMPEEIDWSQTGYTGAWTIPTEADTSGAEEDVAALDGTLGPISVDVEYNPVIAQPLEGPIQGPVASPGAGLEDRSITISAVDEATPVIEEVITAAGSIPETEETNVSAPGASEATTALNEVTSAAQAIPEAEMVNVFVFGAAAAVQALNEVAAAAASIPESVSTTITTNRVTNYSTTGVPPGSPGFILPGGRTGGIVGELGGYAHGGMIPFVGGENGPELAYFAHGGVAALPLHGIYSAPGGTYISPNNSTASSGLGGGGLSVNVTVEGNVYGIDDLIEATTRALAPAIAETARTIYREQGVEW